MSSMFNAISFGGIPPAILWLLIGFVIVFSYMGLR